MYIKEDFKFLSMDANMNMGKEKVFAIEDKLSIEEKINFIDELEDGIATYIVSIFDKWEKEKDSLSKDNWGSIKTVSKKAWIKRNDERKKIDNDFKLGTYYLFGTKYKEMSLICPTSEYGHNFLYTGDSVVKQWFHDLCSKLYNQERIYFESINPFEIKVSKIKEYAEGHHIYFDSEKINDIAWNGKKDITEKELNIYLEAYKKIEEYIETITKDVKVQIDKIVI